MVWSSSIYKRDVVSSVLGQHRVSIGSHSARDREGSPGRSLLHSLGSSLCTTDSLPTCPASSSPSSLASSPRPWRVHRARMCRPRVSRAARTCSRVPLHGLPATQAPETLNSPGDINPGSTKTTGTAPPHAAPSPLSNTASTLLSAITQPS